MSHTTQNNINSINTMPLYVESMTLLFVCWNYFPY